MANTYSVILNTETQVQFPPECVVCTKPFHGTLTLFDNMPSHAVYREFDQSGHAKKIRISLHQKCIRKSNRAVDAILIIIFVVGIVSYTLLRIEYDFMPFIALFAFVVVAYISILWNKLSTKPLKCISDGSQLTFEFKNKRYAEQFATLNNSNIL